MRYAPGTWGTAVGTCFYLPLAWLADPWQTLALLFGALIASAITISNGDWCERHFMGKDPQPVVTDEIAGVLLTLAIFHNVGNPWVTLLWAFPVNRFFDIIKFPPARQLEKLPKGWGILCDDLVSSTYAGLLLWTMRMLFPKWFGGT